MTKQVLFVVAYGTRTGLYLLVAPAAVHAGISVRDASAARARPHARPTHPLFNRGSLGGARCRAGDASAMIWQIPEGPTGANSGPLSPPIVMAHPINVPNKDVTSLEWSVRVCVPHCHRALGRPLLIAPLNRNGDSQPNGQLLATGAYDGAARIWSNKGTAPRAPPCTFSCPCRRGVLR